MSTHLLLILKLLDNWRNFHQNLVCLLVVFELGGDEVGEVAEGFGCIQNLCRLACASSR